jgi:hypothetical protein
MPNGGFDPRQTLTGLALVAALIAGPLALETADLGAVPSITRREGVLQIIDKVRAAQATYRSVHGYYDRIECLVQDSCVPNAYPPTYLAVTAARGTAYGYRMRLADGPAVQPGTTEFVSGTGMTAYAFVAEPVESVRDPAVLPSYCADAVGVFEYLDGRAPRVADGRCLDRSHPLF